MILNKCVLVSISLQCMATLSGEITCLEENISHFIEGFSWRKVFAPSKSKHFPLWKVPLLKGIVWQGIKSQMYIVSLCKNCCKTWDVPIHQNKRPVLILSSNISFICLTSSHPWSEAYYNMSDIIDKKAYI